MILLYSVVMGFTRKVDSRARTLFTLLLSVTRGDVSTCARSLGARAVLSKRAAGWWRGVWDWLWVRREYSQVLSVNEKAVLSSKKHVLERKLSRALSPFYTRGARAIFSGMNCKGFLGYTRQSTRAAPW